ncbi:unnamed protein product [Diabrotica balteata]|uniref:Uncharacterized protein n=1 Tax=Diabrotica balteata TaxID=107213 RepID=A0A9N9T5N9_DIABA|nr:unnamed protein product [Diabrotica balteata]
MQSILCPSDYQVTTPDSTLGDVSSDDDVMDRTWIPNSVQDAGQLSSSSDDSTYARNTVTSSVTAETLGNVRVKRKCGIGIMQRKLRKERSEKIGKGEEYTNQSGKKILRSTFTDYRSLQTRDMQRLHLSHHILLSKPVRVKIENAIQKRDISVQYGIEIDGRRENVCQQCFRIVGIRIIGRDEKGRHEPKIKHSTAAVAYVHIHITSFPAYESHYSRSHTTKQYLETGLNLQKMLYKKNRLHEEHVSQQQKAKVHYECKSLDKQHAKSLNNTTVVAVCDLQQCLATPFLNTRVAFFKRKLWT